MTANSNLKKWLTIVDDRVLLDTLKKNNDNYQIEMNNGKTYKISFEKKENSITVSLKNESQVIIDTTYFGFVHDYTKEEIRSDFKLHNGLLIETKEETKEKGYKIATMIQPMEIEETTNIRMYEVKANTTLGEVSTITPKLVSVKQKVK